MGLGWELDSLQYSVRDLNEKLNSFLITLEGALVSFLNVTVDRMSCINFGDLLGLHILCPI